MQITNTTERYGIVAITFHWVMALIVIALLCVGLYMVTLKLGPQKLALFRYHKEFGTLVLMLVCLRLGWRLANITPVLPTSMPRWQQFAAHGTHFLLYALLFALPMTGWLLSSASGFLPSFFGLFVLPPLFAPDEGLTHLFETIHQWLAYSLIALLCAHIGAALEHHFVEKDNILRRML
jgi:cytochrome b561